MLVTPKASVKPATYNVAGVAITVIHHHIWNPELPFHLLEGVFNGLDLTHIHWQGKQALLLCPLDVSVIAPYGNTVSFLSEFLRHSPANSRNPAKDEYYPGRHRTYVDNGYLS